MNIEVNYKNKRYYNTARYPIRQPLVMTALLALVSKIMMPRIPYKIEKINMDTLKPPYILLSNHMYFVDFQLSAMATFPHRVNNVATIDGYYRRPWLMELLGCICKRKFTNDLQLVRSIRRVLQRGDVLCMYPEARYSPVGTTAILPDSLGKLIKMNSVPVVVMLHHGNYLHTPFWNYRKKRKVPLHTTLTQILTAEDVKAMSSDEIMAAVRTAMKYDDHRWQKEQGILIREPYRAEGLHKVLYQCPACKAEHKMTSSGSRLKCTACGKEWEFLENGSLRALTGKTEFEHIPDWYEWERSQVRQQIERGEYAFCDEVDVYSLPRCMRFEHLGKAQLRHNSEEGFVLEGEYRGKPYRVHRTPKEMYGVHIEYDYCYIKPCDCIDISTENDSFYCYPTLPDVVTKLSLATEEIYKLKMNK
ncbi:MAG: 1-acyl-sn-glycerol-3-phosphate acyltransferase [Clostridia bacterium]|nr:1-acyl-sn-glycerol-3-phosphate acyltransferase [Clostridia bacterium]